MTDDTAKLKRYELELNGGEPWAEPAPDGDWVLFDDAQAALDAAVAAERKRCAQICERAAKLAVRHDLAYHNGWAGASLSIAQAIRGQELDCLNRHLSDSA